MNLFRIFSFIVLCIGTRIFISYLITHLSNTYKNILNIILFFIGISFLIIYLFKLRKTGIEVDGEKIWWNFLRPIHGSLYLLASIFLFFNYKLLSSYTIILDTFIGLSFYILHYLNFY
jgi:uncharacterized membrane protein YdcZ (DUF606 family)